MARVAQGNGVVLERGGKRPVALERRERGEERVKALWLFIS